MTDDAEGRSKAVRRPWQGNERVDIVAGIAEVKQHPAYAAAKNGDPVAAVDLAERFLAHSWIEQTGATIRAGNPVIVAVHAIEGKSSNMIPQGMAVVLAAYLELDVDTEILQVNRAGHTGASGWKRLGNPAIFDGPVDAGRQYRIVDDFVGQGGTIANLRGHLIAGGGRFAGATALTGKDYSAIIGLSRQTLNDLRRKHGDLENWWTARFGYGFDALTESEARYLLRAEDADTIRASLAAGQ